MQTSFSSSKVNVILLDGSVETFEFDPRSSTGLALMGLVCRHLGLPRAEADYFGLAVAVVTAEGDKRVCPTWLKLDRLVRKQESFQVLCHVNKSAKL